MPTRNMKRLLFILLFLPFCLSAQIGAVGKINAYIVLGSSNANGSGQATVLSSTTPYYQVNGNVKIWDSLNMVIYDPILNNNQQPAYVSKNGYFSFALPMSYELAKLSNNTVCLIQYAWGGTVLYDTTAFISWNVAKYNQTNNLWYQSKRWIQRGIASLNTTYGVNNWNLQGIIWMHQNDAVNLRMANAYETNLGLLVDSLRTITGLATTPLYIVRNSSGLSTYTYNNTLRTAQTNVVAAKANCILVDSDSYSLGTDNIHFNSAGQIAIGQYFLTVLAYEKRLIFRYK